MAVVFLPIILLAALPNPEAVPVTSAPSLQESAASPPAKPATPPTLKGALDLSAWDPAQRGPLLLVAPDVIVSKPLWAVQYDELRKKGANTSEMKPPLPVPASNGQYRVPEIASFYGRRLVRLKGISVLAPETMMVLNDNPGKHNIFDGMQQAQKVQMFQATLSDAQWALLGSDRGLGIGDLKQDQRDLFLSLLPDPFHVMRGTAMADGGTRFGGENPQPPTRLVGNERLGIRLRLNRSIQMALLGQGGAQTVASVNDRREGQEVFHLNTWDTGLSENKAFGQTLRSTVPVRLKPQQIDFDGPSLSAPIALAGAKTVGDLVERIRTVTRVELYVDPRLAKQSVWLKTNDETTLRAGELLRAVCWSIAGAVRYIENGRVFVLTDDIAGWGTRVARIQAWINMGNSLKQRQLQEYAKEIRKREPIQYLKFSEDDPLAVNPERMTEIEGSWKTPRGRYQGISVPIQSLSEEQQALARSTAAAHNARITSGERTLSEYDRPVHLENVRMTFRVRLYFVVPGTGAVEDSSSGWGIREALLPAFEPAAVAAELAKTPDAPKKTITLPLKSPVGGVLNAAPKDIAQARTVVQIAREQGFRHVWITVPPPRFGSKSGPESNSAASLLPDFDLAAREGQALLAAAIDEAQSAPKRPVAVVATVGLLTATSDQRSVEPVMGESVDLNLLGETAVQSARRQADIAALAGREKHAKFLTANAKEWLLPDTPGLRLG